MSQSVWPFDHAHEPGFAAKTEQAAADLDVIDVFIICPSKPSEHFDDLLALMRSICGQIKDHYGVTLRCNRALDIRSAGLIHPEIWQAIRSADIVLADLTGLNGNVLYELGVAAAWHRKEHIIVIRERPPEGQTPTTVTPEQWLFDIQPVRHIQYVRTHAGFARLANELADLLLKAVAAAPFELVEERPMEFPQHFDFTGSVEPPGLLMPSPAHRRQLVGRYLEFGSLHSFPHCWASVGNLQVRNVEVKARLGFSKFGRPPVDMPWFGLMLRSQSFWANHGHLVHVRRDGSVRVTLEVDGEHTDELIGQLEPFTPGASGLVDVSSTIDSEGWRVSVGSVTWHKPVHELPFVFNQGRILIQGWFTWLALQSLSVIPSD